MPDIFIDLLYNAERAMQTIDDPCIRIHASVSGAYAFVEVSDNGPGVPEDMRDRMFEPSQSTGGSSGLGLTIIKGLVEKHGGFIEYRAIRGRGSCFTIKLPHLLRQSEPSGN